MATAYQPTGTEKFNTYIVDYITYHRKPSDHIYIQPVIRRVFGTTGSVKSGLSKADYLGEISFLSRERREESLINRQGVQQCSGSFCVLKS